MTIMSFTPRRWNGAATRVRVVVGAGRDGAGTTWSDVLWAYRLCRSLHEKAQGRDRRDEEDVRDPLWLTGEGVAARDELPLPLEARVQGRQDGAVQLRQAVRYREAASVEMQRRPCPCWQGAREGAELATVDGEGDGVLVLAREEARADRGGEQGSR
jgi:hypothetical protein